MARGERDEKQQILLFPLARRRDGKKSPEKICRHVATKHGYGYGECHSISLLRLLRLTRTLAHSIFTLFPPQQARLSYTTRALKLPSLHWYWVYFRFTLPSALEDETLDCDSRARFREFEFGRKERKKNNSERRRSFIRYQNKQKKI